MSTAAGHFDQLYAVDDDPWQFRTSWYEIRKRLALLSSLPRPHYQTAFEPGCANGEFTAALAPRCDRVLAWDCSAKAVELARQRLQALPQVVVERHSVPSQWPAGRLDLIVINELAYFLDEADLAQLCLRLGEGLQQGSTVLACHWRHAESASGLNAVDLHHSIGEGLACPLHAVHHIEPDFVLDAWTPASGNGGNGELRI